MRPKFLEVIQLGVLVGVIAVAVAVAVTSYSQVDSVVNSVAGVYYSQHTGGLSAPSHLPGGGETGVSGIFSTFLFLTKLVIYGVICMLFGCALYLFASMFGVFTTAIEKILNGIVGISLRIRSRMVPPPLAMDTVLEVSPDGKPTVLRNVLRGLSNGVRMADKNYSALKEDIAALQQLTAGLTPPPPPKPIEEIAAELQAELERTRAELAAAKAAKPVVTPAPVPTPEPAK